MHKGEILQTLVQSDFDTIYRQADAIRRETVGDVVHIRAILEFSNHCRRNCIYCGLNCGNRNIARYRMSPDEILKTGKAAFDAGYKTLVLQSGEDRYYTPQLLGEIVSELKDYGLIITLSCGEFSDDDFAYLKSSGADRYLLKHETSDPEIYATLHPGYQLDSRIHCLKTIKKLGYETGSGFMIGLPNQTLSTIADDILLLKELSCDMAGIGPFIPHPETPLHDIPSGSIELTKRAVALTRILIPHIHLPVTTSLGVQCADARRHVFSAGANVIMRKVTPEPYKSLYQIYPAKLTVTDISSDRLELEEFIKSLGRVPQ